MTAALRQTVARVVVAFHTRSSHGDYCRACFDAWPCQKLTWVSRRDGTRR